MEPINRPYVDPHTKPGDEGTEDWADEPKPGETPAWPAKTDEHGAIVGSPADIFDDQADEPDDAA